MQRRLLVLLVIALVLVTPVGEAAKKRRTPKPTSTPGPVYGPPVPTPRPLFRAAGSCLKYEPNQFLLVAEVGEAGRVFWIDAETLITVSRLHTGTRVRVLYVEDPNGPLARKVMPGPVDVAPTASASGAQPPAS